jgi:selenide,water dikinase
LTQVLRPLREVFDPGAFPDLLVGLHGPDDAAVWRIADDRALVITTDFFTPVVDDAYDYGAVAAANSLSDVYAMGGQPFLALNIAAFPEDLPAALCAEILRGGAEKAREAGVVIAGGHSVKDSEPKYGLVALGWVDPRRMIRKSGLEAGDLLVLTKPLGTGVTSTALKQQRASPEHVAEATTWMKGLNRGAAQVATEFDVRGGTDITGFGLLGHAAELANASDLALQFDQAQLPFLGGAHAYAREGTFPGGAFDNREHFHSQVSFEASLEGHERMLLFDPQTSGGLLLGVKPEKIAAFLGRAKDIGQPVWVVGRAQAGRGITVTSGSTS